MKDNKLISTTDYVLEESSSLVSVETWEKFRQNSLIRIFNYANFLKQPLTLGMFIPCDEDGNVLEKPDGKDIFPFATNEEENELNDAIKQFQEAKERVLFEGQKKIEGENYAYHRFQLECIDDVQVLVMRVILNNEETHWHAKIYFDKYKTIEDLVPLDLTLTPNAIRLINK